MLLKSGANIDVTVEDTVSKKKLLELAAELANGLAERPKISKEVDI